MQSRFFDIPGTHPPAVVSEPSTSSIPLLSRRRQEETYFSYQATPTPQKISSKYDPDNPNKNKLGTIDGVFVPTALNVLSILMFLRFGFILGQLGIICTIGLLLLSYLINLLTTLSISAISTNGTVRGGGAYYMISRCLGPEFGGSIGLVFFLGQVLNSGMNAVGIVEPLLYNFGADAPDTPAAVLYPLFPRSYWYTFTYSTVILFVCFAVSVVGSQMVSRAGNFLFVILIASIISIPISAFTRAPFSLGDLIYTGPSWKTFYGNLFPHLTAGAAGSLLKTRETFNDLFGVFFPATAGIFAGAGMSSELRKPSKSIPKGTLWGLLFTFVCYTAVVSSMSFTIPRETLYVDVQVVQSVSSVQWLILLGELSTSLFSIIVGMVGAAYVLEAIAKDSIVPGLDIFWKKPLYSLTLTWILTQLCLFADVNKIATFITMTFLITFFVMNLACFLLKVAAAPNFRPSFKYFDRYTALAGAILSIFAMVIVDTLTASALILVMIILFLLIHYYCPPKPWGDVSQSLIYHQVRKYLLRLRQDNIKYWRPQILLFVDNPRTSWNLIRFCNHLKKGGLYILGHVTVAHKFQSQFNELRKQNAAWVKIRDMARIKAFVQVGTGPDLVWGVRNVYLGSGLGGMKPNISVIGFFDLDSYRRAHALQRSHSHSSNGDILDQLELDIPSTTAPLPTDDCKNEKKVSARQWVEIIEDLSLMRSNVAVARGFKNLDLPTSHDGKVTKKRVIDLYPIQMCATVETERDQPSLITNNFDTYTLILQLGAILATVPEWKRSHELRVILFVENESERVPESQRMENLLQILRIEASVLVVSLDQFRVYNTIVRGDTILFDYVDSILKDNEWWRDLVNTRKSLDPRYSRSELNHTSTTLQHKTKPVKVRKYDFARLQKLGLSFKMSSSMPMNFIEGDVSDTDLDNMSIHPVPSPIPRKVKDKSPKKGAKKSGTSAARGELHKSPSSISLKPVFASRTLPKTKIIEDGTGDKPTIIPIADEPSLQSSVSRNTKKSVMTEISPCCSNSSSLERIQNLCFNDLPSLAQHLVLNDLMIQLSKDSNLIFTTLPIPPLGTHYDEDASLEYIENLDRWLDGLPPTMLINSQTMTVTTAL